MNKTMLAMMYRGKGDIRLEERPVPQLLEPGDAIVKVEESSICASDLHIRNGAVPRAREGVILGHEFAGEIVQVGDGVKRHKVGDRVAANVEAVALHPYSLPQRAGYAGSSFCGECFYCKGGCYVNNCVHGGWELGCHIDGFQAEYVRVPFADNCLYPIPAGLDYEDVA